MDNSNISIYCKPNPYGYKYNVNHPWINNLYRRYCQWKGFNRPMTDAERFDFESYIDELINKQ